MVSRGRRQRVEARPRNMGSDWTLLFSLQQCHTVENRRTDPGGHGPGGAGWLRGPAGEERQDPGAPGGEPASPEAGTRGWCLEHTGKQVARGSTQVSERMRSWERRGMQGSHSSGTRVLMEQSPEAA